MKSRNMGWEVVNSNSTTTTIRTRFLFPIRDSHRRRDSRRVFKIIIGGVAIAPPDNKTKDGDEEDKKSSYCADYHSSRQLAVKR